MAKVYSGEFGETAGWVLVNDYTIHEAKRLKDRPFMITRVPKSLCADLLDVVVSEGVEWACERWYGELSVDDGGNLVASDPTEKRDNRYALKRAIHGRATFKDTITVFSINDGAIAKFQSFDSVRITPLPVGKIGGKNKATTVDGLGFSGMSSRDVPAGGLMEGEPGKIWLDDGKHEPNVMHATLNAELYLDEDQFNSIFVTIRDRIRPPDTARLSIAAELFEGEVQACLSEPWMDREYGIIKKGDWVQTRARLDSIYVGFTKIAEHDAIAEIGRPTVTASRDEQHFLPLTTTPDGRVEQETQRLLRVLIKRSGWVLATLVAILIVNLLK